VNKATNIPEVDFSFVRYANCWEDPHLLIEALKPAPGNRILSIASAGDNSLSLLAFGTEMVATDLNPAQLACTELRKEAIRAMDRESFLRFAGIVDASDRISSYQSIRPALSANAQRYWDTQQHDIASGFIHAGKFEHYFQLFRKRIVPLIHGKRTVEALLQEKNLAERRRFYQQIWNNRRWRLLFRLFFSRRIMGRHGRDPEFFRHVEGRVADRIMERVKHALINLDTAANPYLSYILTGNFTTALPHYLHPDNYTAIRLNIDNLSIRHGAIDAVAQVFGPGSFDGFNLSDIFEYLSPEQCETVYGHLLSSARPQARLAYWNMLVPRERPACFADRVASLEDDAQSLLEQDMAFFYSRFVVEEVR
jgi:S-adenosylmethionine-diacylglycerol 3-amino-3-carboxypropyl transferase